MVPCVDQRNFYEILQLVIVNINYDKSQNKN